MPSDCAIDNEKIERIQDIDFERFRGVGVILLQIEPLFSLLMSFGNRFILTKLAEIYLARYEIIPMLKIYDEQVVYRFYEREKEDVAVFLVLKVTGLRPLGKTGSFCYKRVWHHF